MKKVLKILLAIALIIIYCSVIIFCIMKIPMNSDAGCMMLYAEDILSGNIFLSGWSLTGLTFMATDLPFYVIGVAIAGVGLNAFRIAIALMYLFMAFGALLLGLYGVERKWTAALFISAVGLIPTVYALSNAFVHTGVFALLFMALLFAQIYNNTAKKYAVIALGVITALAVCSDGLSLMLITVPIIVLCYFKVFERPVSVAASVILGTGAGMAIQKLYLIMGGAELNSLPHNKFILIPRLWDNVRIYIESILRLNNSWFFTKELFSLKTVIFAVKVLILLFAMYIVFCAVKEVFKKGETDIPTAALGIGTALITAVLLLTTINANITVGRYIAYLPLMLGVALARCTDLFAVLKKPLVTAGVMGCCVLLTAANLLPHMSYITPNNTYSELAEFLEENNLTYGYATFWDASVVTAYSENRIKLRAIHEDSGKLCPRMWFSKKDWYDTDVSFVVVRNGGNEEEFRYNYNGIFNLRLDCSFLYGSYEEQLNGITYDTVTGILGQPATEKSFKNYTVLIYDKPINEG